MHGIWRKCGAVAVLCLLFAGCSGEDDEKPGLGASCSTTDQCASGLVCADIGGSARVLFQCTSRCNSSEECRNRHGTSFCIGTNYCVVSCQDTGCPSGDFCNQYDWCE